MRKLRPKKVKRLTQVHTVGSEIWGNNKNIFKGALAVDRMCWDVTLPVCSESHVFCGCVAVYLALHICGLYSLAWEGDIKSKQMDCVSPPGSSVNRLVVRGFYHQPEP